jgi:hypothetical protein
MAKKLVEGPVIRPAGRYGPFKNKKRAKGSATVRTFTHFPETIPAEMAGKYVVWSPDGMQIVGSGSTMAEALEIAAFEDGRLIQRVPKTIHALPR